MKLKEVIGIILMVILTISGVLLSCAASIVCVISSKQITNFMVDTTYFYEAQDEVKLLFLNYMSENKAEQILENISVKEDIRKFALAFDNNQIEQTAISIKNAMKNVVISSLDEDVTDDTKDAFATIVSDAYIKTIFPVAEFNMLSGIYKTYINKVLLALVIITVICIVSYVYLACGKKTYKWAIIALYNIIIINVILVIALGTFNEIVIGNERTTSVILSMLNKIKLNIIVAIIITFVIAVISNYIAYFRKKKHLVKSA